MRVFLCTVEAEQAEPDGRSWVGGGGTGGGGLFALRIFDKSRVYCHSNVGGKTACRLNCCIPAQQHIFIPDCLRVGVCVFSEGKLLTCVEMTRHTACV